MQEPLHVRILLIPCCETMNGERMSQVVNSRLLACVSSADAREIAQISEMILKRVARDGIARPSCKKWGIGWPMFWPSTVILNQCSCQLRSYGNQSRFAEFRVLNRQERPVQIHIGTS